MPNLIWIGRDGDLADSDGILDGSKWANADSGVTGTAPGSQDNIIFQKGSGGPLQKNLALITADIKSVAVLGFEHPIGGQGNPWVLDVTDGWNQDAANPVWWSCNGANRTTTVTISRDSHFHLFWGLNTFKPKLNVMAGRVVCSADNTSNDGNLTSFRLSPKDSTQRTTVVLHEGIEMDDGIIDFVVEGGELDIMSQLTDAALSSGQGRSIVVSGGVLRQHGSFGKAPLIQTGGVVQYMPRRNDTDWTEEGKIFGGLFDASKAERGSIGTIRIFPRGRYKIRLDSDLTVVDYRLDFGGGGGGGIG